MISLLPQTRFPSRLVMSALMSTLLWLPLNGSHAQTGPLNDRNQPLMVEADAVTYSDVTQTSNFTGNVIVRQGNTQIQAARVEVLISPEGYQYATAQGGANGLVRFKQKRDGAGDWIEGQAERLIFDGKTQVISLANRAQVRRLDAQGRLLDQINGAELTYNQLTEVFASNANRKGRTHVIITPRTRDAARGAP